MFLVFSLLEVALFGVVFSFLVAVMLPVSMISSYEFVLVTLSLPTLILLWILVVDVLGLGLTLLFPWPCRSFNLHWSRGL